MSESSAAQVQRLTDVIVEHTPGDRALAERIAVSVLAELHAPRMILPGIDQDPVQLAAAMRGWRPMLVAPERDDAEIAAEALLAAASEVERLDRIGNRPPAESTYEERLAFATSPLFQPARELDRADVAEWLRDRAAALTAASPGREGEL